MHEFRRGMALGEEAGYLKLKSAIPGGRVLRPLGVWCRRPTPCRHLSDPVYRYDRFRPNVSLTSTRGRASFTLMPVRARQNPSPRCAILRYNARGPDINRISHKATISSISSHKPLGNYNC